MSVTVNGLVIDDLTNYIVEEITYRNIPSRDFKNVGIARRSASKLTATEYKSKEIKIKGRVFDTTYANLLTRLDTMQQNFSVVSLALSIDSGRTYTATLEKLDIPTMFYNQTMIQYEALFLAHDPYAYGTQITASGTVVSGTVTYSGSLTVSGSVFAGPTITINPTSLFVGDSGIKAMQFSYTPTGETLTVSGLFNYASPVTIDYFNFLVTNSGVASDYTGIFSRFAPGTINYTITTTSGLYNGYNYTWAYQPRYYQ